MAKKTVKPVRTLQEVIQEYSNKASLVGDKECQIRTYTQELPRLYADMQELVKEANALREDEKKRTELASAAVKTATQTEAPTPLQAVK